MWSTPNLRRGITDLLVVLLGLSSAAQAAEPSFTTNADIDFGRIVNLTNSSCALSASSGALTGPSCLDSTGVNGDIDIQANANQSYSITLFPPAGPSNHIEFQPLMDNGSSSKSVTSGADGRINLRIGGVLTTSSTAPMGGATTQFTYTIRVDSN